jgi:hypothetical protein
MNFTEILRSCLVWVQKGLLFSFAKYFLNFSLLLGLCMIFLRQFKLTNLVVEIVFSHV